MTAPAVEHGDPGVVFPNEILRTVVGSEVLGLALPGTGDRDEMGIYIPPADHVLGVLDHRDDYVSRTCPEGVRSGPGDTDLIIYSLRKYLRLAIKGNPTVLLPLFAPAESLIVTTPLGDQLRSMRNAFLSREAVERFLGYMHSQHLRMLGESSRNVPNRPELIAKHGWDTKYGSHALRLAYQGFELASAGTLTLPMRDIARDHVLSVKNGESTREHVSAAIRVLEVTVRQLLERNQTPLPAKPDIQAITDWAVYAQQRHWHIRTTEPKDV